VFEGYKAPPADSIVELMLAFRNDPRTDKKDLGIGAYKDSNGQTPVMRAIKAAEKKVWETETSKSYLGLAGDEQFCGHILDLVLGKDMSRERVRSIQTVGGGAAVRLLCDLLAAGDWRGSLWIPNPTWINHVPIATTAGLKVRDYTYLNLSTSEVDFQRMMDDLKRANRGDAILLHGCCHNPTGADLTPDQWQSLIELIQKLGLLPFVDVAYQGFGDGLLQDVQGLRLLAAGVPEMVLSTSCSKNFGVYRDRVGTAIVIANNGTAADKARAVLLAKGRVNYSFPPNHGAATVSTIFNDEALLQDWKSELESMRLRMVRNRVALADQLKRATNTERFNFIKRHKGMFSLVGLSTSQISRLRDEFAVFMPPDGRMNIAAVNEADLEVISNAVAAVI
jgi:aspartate aminotransferase